jgi:hypothetical protein
VVDIPLKDVSIEPPYGDIEFPEDSKLNTFPLEETVILSV